MAVKRRAQGDQAIDMGPFADIAFLLIIFFILTTSLSRPWGKQIDMPAVTESKEKEKADNLTVDVQDTKILLSRNEKDFEEINIEQLRTKLLALDLPKKEEKERMIVVNLAAKVKFERFYQVLTAISHAGGVVTLIEEEETKEATNDST